MDRHQFSAPRFHLRDAPGLPRYDIEMGENRSTHSFAGDDPRPATADVGRRRSRSSDLADWDERPNLVISGHRRLGRNFYTGRGTNFENHANRIVAKLERDDALMKDTPASEQMRREALRDLPQGLTIKRCVKKQLSISVSRKSTKTRISVWRRFKYGTRMSLARFIYKLKTINYFYLWHDTLKDIEGRFGSGYASYFKFLRWIFVMNFLVAVVSFSMIVVPQIIYDSGVASDRDNFSFEDIFTGEGFLNKTVFYYGHYLNTFTQVLPHLPYSMPAAYFATVICLYLASFVVLAVSVAQSYRRTFIETEGGLHNIYASRIFCGWDYGIATREAAELKSLSIFNELKELLSEEANESERRSGGLYSFHTCAVQVVVNVVVLALLAAVGWVTWLLLDLRLKNAVVLTAIEVNFVMAIFPPIFKFISDYEDYKNPRSAFYATLVRTYLLGSVLIGVVISFWLIRAADDANIDCWEDRLGAEMYRLIVFDFIFAVVLTGFADVGYYLGRRLVRRDAKSEFNIAGHTLQIVYNQGLFWVGFVYSPVLPTLVTVKMLVLWYVRVGCVRKLCKPPERTWRAAQAQTWFKMMIFFSILMIIAVHGYTMTSIEVSSCGPFTDYVYIYQILTDSIAKIEDGSDFWRIILTVTKPGGVAFILLALVVSVYYVREQAQASREKVKILRNMLVSLINDKKSIVQRYHRSTNGRNCETRFRTVRLLDPSKVLTHDYFEGDLEASDLQDAGPSTQNF